ncbi:hypothetical protein JNK13_06960 [bacterium]|nr:hypothetical protein [bacterium]
MQLLDYAKEKRAPETLIKRLLELYSSQTRIELVDAISLLQPSIGNLDEISRLLADLATRDGKQVELILTECQLREIIALENLSTKDKLKKLRLNLERLRYPERLKIFEALAVAQKEIVNEYGLKIEFPQDLEGTELNLELKIKSPEELITVAKQLELLGNASTIKKMFSLLRGV